MDGGVCSGSCTANVLIGPQYWSQRSFTCNNIELSQKLPPSILFRHRFQEDHCGWEHLRFPCCSGRVSLSRFFLAALTLLMLDVHPFTTSYNASIAMRRFVVCRRCVSLDPDRSIARSGIRNCTGKQVGAFILSTTSSKVRCFDVYLPTKESKLIGVE
jgi:hypothetical protein